MGKSWQLKALKARGLTNWNFGKGLPHDQVCFLLPLPIFCQSSIPRLWNLKAIESLLLKTQSVLHPLKAWLKNKISRVCWDSLMWFPTSTYFDLHHKFQHIIKCILSTSLCIVLTGWIRSWLDGQGSWSCGTRLSGNSFLGFSGENGFGWGIEKPPESFTVLVIFISRDPRAGPVKGSGNSLE